jgi:hypothetical protein
LDKEASHHLKQFLDNNNIEFELVPPHLHHHNGAEQAIRTFKNHFIAGLCSTDKLFPMNLWCRLVRQAEITLNLLHALHLNPRLSTYAQLNGAFDYNATPLAPPGIKCIIHEKPGQRGSWAPHSIDGWYVGPAMEHYCCWTVHVTSTNSECIGDTVEFFPQYTKVPRLSSADATTYAARDLIYALQHPQPAGLFAPTDPTLEALKKLANIFAATLPLTETAAAPRVEVPTSQPPNTHHQYNTHSQAQPSIAATIIASSKETVNVIIDPSSSTIHDCLAPLPMAQPEAIPPMEFAASVIDPATGKAMEYQQLIPNPGTKSVLQASKYIPVLNTKV